MDIKRMYFKPMQQIPKNIHPVKFPNFTFANITVPGKAQINYLKENFPFHWIDLQDVLPPLQYPKLIVHDNYIFMV